MDAGVKVEGLRQSSSKYSPILSHFHYSLQGKISCWGSLPPLSSFDVEGTRDDSSFSHLSSPFSFPSPARLLVFILQFFFSFSFFPRDKPRQQIFTDGHRAGRSNKYLIVLTILSVLHEFYRVFLLSLVKQRSFAFFFFFFFFCPL